MVMSRSVTLPRASSFGVIWDWLPTTTMASLDGSMYLLATRETSAAVTFCIRAGKVVAVHPTVTN